MVRVLLVDDDEATREVLRDVLEAEGYVVSEAADDHAALEMLRASLHPCVVLVDVVMPLDGQEFLRAVAADGALASRHCYVIMTAARPADVQLPDEVQCIVTFPVVFKPFELDAFLATVAEAAKRLDELPGDRPAPVRSRPRPLAGGDQGDE